MYNIDLSYTYSKTKNHWTLTLNECFELPFFLDKPLQVRFAQEEHLVLEHRQDRRLHLHPSRLFTSDPLTWPKHFNIGLLLNPEADH